MEMKVGLRMRRRKKRKRKGLGLVDKVATGKENEGNLTILHSFWIFASLTIKTNTLYVLVWCNISILYIISNNNTINDDLIMRSWRGDAKEAYTLCFLFTYYYSHYLILNDFYFTHNTLYLIQLFHKVLPKLYLSL